MTTNPLAPYVQHHEFCAGRMLRQADRSFKFEGCNCGLSQALEAQDAGMTDDEISELARLHVQSYMQAYSSHDHVHAIIAVRELLTKVRAKSYRLPVGEPVAWMTEEGKVVSASGKLRMEEAEHPVGIHYDIALYRLPKGRAMGEDAPSNGQWIPVEERLPQRRALVMASHAPSRGVYPARLTGPFGPDEPETEWLDMYDKCRDVTHWMPLPSPPSTPDNKDR